MNTKKKNHIGKYGHLRLEYLKIHKKADYTIMFMDGTLRKYIVDTDKQAKARYDILMKQMLEKNPIEKLYLYQKEEFENQIVNIDTALKKAEIEEGAKFDMITDKLQKLLKDKDYSEINKMIIDYELAKFKHEDMMYFLYYKLGFNDSSKLYK